ncbi:uncharacterized protein BDZ99DRAFT_276369 [Mytilinidion resinicola]|uniref:TM7S3/TM198-like domain-containing protein n=1 Tax=Mytilinidion resinicola TaxID=574789 RepID=A0A6A6YRD8_9PEZI|nr:uncharacterized protein BDZ99DRAFT_276369 [Mytilinidion resinicola]KAF2811496.1 hypothetical protein BDZ99DRAFT_276369 [Mytilinidion resinicola]
MRSYRYLVSSLALIALLHPAVALNYPLDARQNDQTSSHSTSPSTTDASQASSTGGASLLPSSASEKAAATSSHHEASSQPSSTLSMSVTPTESISAPSSSIANAAEPSATNGTASHGSPLPIHPKLTPAMGITGVVLLLTGIVYTAIGIKNKMLYVFFSACYLTSLATTVLIIYLMSPPVKDAIQGAFFVAALISGLIFGALSLVFADITDGLGCLLGGYCLSMWFLTLKEGGLIESTTGRAVFIACMSFAGFSLSFSHYTRTYGLIVSISFAGATATVLGIDCLSRAGLKEFWLYLWNLNSNTFPLNTKTYPVTRGIRVEVAFIILIFLLGIVSQLKLWKLVKERRERGAMTRMEREENQQREEEERGRRIENDFARERAQWEAEYGDKSVAGLHTDSAIGSSNGSNPKTSLSVKETRRSDSVEMVDMSGSKELDRSKLMSRDSVKGGLGVGVTVRVMEDDNIQHIDSDGNTVSLYPATARNSDFHSSANSSARASADMRAAQGGDEAHLGPTRASLRSSVPPPPIVVPLPFNVPKSEHSDNEDNASVSTVPESMPSRRPGSKRFSAISSRLSINRISSNHSSQEEILIPHIEDDRASSLAATMDDMDDDNFSLPELSPPQSPSTEGFQDHIDIHIEGDKTEEQGLKSDEGGKKSEDAQALAALTSNSPAAAKSPNRQSLTTSTDPRPNETKPRPLSNGSRRRSGASVANDDEGRTRRTSKSMPSIPQSEVSQGESHIGSLAEVLPEKLSKVVLSYRTNEWAKHLEVADKPELDELQQPPSPGIQVQMGLPEATTPPKVVEKAQPVPVSTRPVSSIQASVPQLTKQSSQPSYQASNTNPFRQPSANRSSSTMSKYSANESTPMSLSRNPSSATVNSIPNIQIPGQYPTGPGAMLRSSSAAKLRGGRNSSMPLMNQTLVESPIEEESANMRFAPSPMPGNPMSRRETLTRNQTTPTTFTPYSSVPNLNIVAASDAGSTRPVNLHTADSDNISLSERKKMIDQENLTLTQRQALMQSRPQQQRQGTWPLAEQMKGFDSHQPNRTSGINHSKQEARLANWRESIRQDTAPALPVVSEEDRRMTMIRERKQHEMEKQQQAMAANARDTMFDSMMRRGDMLDAHREALRRMQASANKNA